MTKTVRLPIYNEVGMETKSYLELEVQELAIALSIVPSRIVHNEGSEIELINVPSKYPEGYEPLSERELMSLISGEAVFADEIIIPQITPDSAWKQLPDIPSKNFEINRDGLIRHKGTKRILEQEYDIDQNAYRSLLIINGNEYSLYGPYIADRLWAKK